MELERPLQPAEAGRDADILAATVRARLFGGEPFRVGRFALERRLGSGGMGVVYLGVDPDLQREVAIKLLRPDLLLGDADGARARMLREAQAMARLRHPNVVVVHEVGEHDGGIYLAMEYVPGTTLRGWLADAERSPRAIISTFVQAGRGLAAAHAVGLVHRDFKPDNVLIGDEAAGAGMHHRICVTDFGLATMPADIVPVTESDISGAHTRTNIAITMSSSGRAGIAGTLAYMAPECLDARPATAASDQFSFCTALFEALFGRRPFGDTPGDIATAMIERRVPSIPRERRVPAAVRAAVLRGLAHDPRARFADMAALLATLERAFADRRVGWLGLGLGLGASVGAALWMTREPPPCRDTDRDVRAAWNETVAETIAARFTATGVPYADATWTRARAGLDAYADGWAAQALAACEATELRQTQSAELLDRRTSCLDGRRRELVALLDVLGDADAKLVDRTTSAVASLRAPERCADLEALQRREPLPDDLAARAHVEQAQDDISAARAAHLAGRFERARETAEQALARPFTHRPTRADAFQQLGNAQIDLGDSAAAVRSFEQAIAMAEAGGADEISASAYDDLIYAHLSRDELDLAERAIRFADAEIEALGNPPEERASLLRMQAELAQRRGDHMAAKRDAEASLALLEHTLASDDPDLAGARLALGNIRYAAGDYEAAIAAYQQAALDFTEILGAEHPRTLGARSNLASVYVQVRRLDEALAEHREILAVRERVLGPEHHLLTANLIAIAAVHFYQHDIPEALVVQQRAIDLLERTRGHEHVETLDARENMAAMLLEADRAHEAELLAAELVELRRRVHGTDAPDLGEALEVYARALAKQDQLEPAAQQVALSIAAIERAHGHDHLSLVDSLALAADLAHLRGQHAQAVGYAERALAIGEPVYGVGHEILAELVATRDRCRAER